MSFEQQLVIRYEFHVLNFKIYHEILHFLSKTYTMQGCWNLSTSGEARPKVGGQRRGILRKNLCFEAILVKFQQKWEGSCPPCPPVSNIPAQGPS